MPQTLHRNVRLTFSNLLCSCSAILPFETQTGTSQFVTARESRELSVSFPSYSLLRMFANRVDSICLQALTTPDSELHSYVRALTSLLTDISDHFRRNPEMSKRHYGMQLASLQLKIEDAASQMPSSTALQPKDKTQ